MQAGKVTLHDDRLIFKIGTRQYSCLASSLQNVWSRPEVPCLVFDEAFGKEAGTIYLMNDLRTMALILGVYLFDVNFVDLREVVHGRQKAAQINSTGGAQSILVVA